MKIGEIMTKDVITVSPQTRIAEVAKILHENNVHGVPVVENKKIVGIITETDFFTADESEIYLPSYIDFLKNISQEDDTQEKFASLLEAEAKDIMSKDCLTLHPDSDVAVMIKLIKEARLHTVPVTLENDELVGIITVADIVALI